jgi:hypothetical protein
MSLVIDGKPEDVPGLRTVSWVDDPRIPRLAGNQDSRRRSTRWIRGIVLHTTKGIPGGKDRRPQVIRPGFGPAGDRGLHVARYWSTSQLQSGAHLIVDFDGEIVQVADLQLEAAYHAGPVNDVSIGVEIYQGSDAELYAEQLAVVVQLCDFLTRRFGIQRQIPDGYDRGQLERLEAGGRNVVGVYGHRDVTSNRGTGDPGDEIMRQLSAAGYERADYSMRIDFDRWADRQHDLGIDADGIPGPATVRALAAAGRPHGMWVSRPGD